MIINGNAVTTVRQSKMGGWRSRAILVSILGLVASLALTGCRNGVQVLSHARVEVDVFSGRENPVVELSQQAADQLVLVLDANSAREDGSLPSQSELGFRGFIVRGLDGTTVKPDDTVVVVMHLLVINNEQVISDPASHAFRIVREDIQGKISADVFRSVPIPLKTDEE